MARKNPNPERGTLIESYDYDDGRLTFVMRYASFEKDGTLRIDTWQDRYGDAKTSEFFLTTEGAVELRKFQSRRRKK